MDEACAYIYAKMMNKKTPRFPNPDADVNKKGKTTNSDLAQEMLKATKQI